MSKPVMLGFAPFAERSILTRGIGWLAMGRLGNGRIGRQREENESIDLVAYLVASMVDSWRVTGQVVLDTQ
jgi:hypothetical protein